MDRLNPETGEWRYLGELPTMPRRNEHYDTPVEAHVVKGRVGYLTDDCSFRLYIEEQNTWEEFVLPFFNDYLTAYNDLEVKVIATKSVQNWL